MYTSCIHGIKQACIYHAYAKIKGKNKKMIVYFESMVYSKIIMNHSLYYVFFFWKIEREFFR